MMADAHTDETEHRPNGCCDYHRYIADGCCHCEALGLPEHQDWGTDTHDPAGRRGVESHAATPHHKPKARRHLPSAPG